MSNFHQAHDNILIQTYNSVGALGRQGVRAPHRQRFRTSVGGATAATTGRRRPPCGFAEPATSRKARADLRSAASADLRLTAKGRRRGLMPRRASDGLQTTTPVLARELSFPPSLAPSLSSLLSLLPSLPPLLPPHSPLLLLSFLVPVSTSLALSVHTQHASDRLKADRDVVLAAVRFPFRNKRGREGGREGGREREREIERERCIYI